MNNCVFCKIVEGEIPATIVRGTPHALAFRSSEPLTPEHIIVIPKRHVKNFREAGLLNGKLIPQVMDLVQQVVASLESQNGYRLVINTGIDAGQTVHHFHVHVLAGRHLGAIASSNPGGW